MKRIERSPRKTWGSTYSFECRKKFLKALDRDLEGNCLGYCVSPIIDIQLAQDFLNMVFNGKRTDGEQVGDLIVALAHLDITQNFGFPFCNELSGFSRRPSATLNSFIEQHAHHRGVQMGHQQIEKICLPAGERNRNLGENEQAPCPSACIKHPVRGNTSQIAVPEVSCELPVSEIGCVAGA